MKDKLSMRLMQGDTIGLASPSHVATHENYDPIIQGIERRGYIVKEATNLYANTYGYSATEQERAADINELVCDETVKMILFGGGEGSIELLPYVDFENIKNHPKMFMSYSDGTTILNAIYQKTGFITYYGQCPYILSESVGYDEEQFRDFCINADVEEMKKNSTWKICHGGTASGILIGGYLLNFALLLGDGRFQPDLSKDYILFLEDHESFFQIPYISAILSYIEQSKFMPHVKGILFGNYSDTENKDLLNRLERLGDTWNIPVCYCDDFGHGKNHAILGIGCKVTLDADEAKLLYL